MLKIKPDPNLFDINKDQSLYVSLEKVMSLYDTSISK